MLPSSVHSLLLIVFLDAQHALPGTELQPSPHCHWWLLREPHQPAAVCQPHRPQVSCFNEKHTKHNSLPTLPPHTTRKTCAGAIFVERGAARQGVWIVVVLVYHHRIWSNPRPLLSGNNRTKNKNDSASLAGKKS